MLRTSNLLVLAPAFWVDSGLVPGIVLIASPDHLAALQEREELTDAFPFSDAEALRALDAITRLRPDVVALERVFAATTRGAALINRIKADPSLTSCEVKIIAHDNSDYSRVSPKRPGDGGAAAVAAVAVAEAAPAVAPLDQRGTRRAPRYRILDGVEVLIDSNPATLVDLSLVGAQVVSPTILRPNQRIRIALPDSKSRMRFSAAVAWASFEIPKGVTRYRAGIEFFDADAAALTKFIEANKKG